MAHSHARVNETGNGDTVSAVSSLPPPATFENERPLSIVRETESAASLHSTTTHRFLRWDVDSKQPLLIATLFLIGIALALSHHFYYKSLDGTFVSSSERQQ